MEEKEWFIKAKKDFKAAEDSFNSKNYEWVCFQAQQAAEKALKSIHIKRHSKLLRTHDLVLLARRINAPQNIVVICSKINPSYIDTRYPDLSRIYTEKDAKEILNLAKEVLKWIEKNL